MSVHDDHSHLIILAFIMIVHQGALCRHAMAKNNKFGLFIPLMKQ